MYSLVQLYHCTVMEMETQSNLQLTQDIVVYVAELEFEPK